MSENKRPITELHADITEWKSIVGLVRSEIEIFQKQLGEIVTKNSHEEVLKGVEHFQNQFIRQLEVSDELLHDLHIVDRQLAEDAAIGDDDDLIYDTENASVKDRVETYNELFLDLKREFHTFLEKWM